MPYSWEPPFVVITASFMAVMSGLGLYQYIRWRKEQRRARAADAEFAAMMQELHGQQHADLAARRLLALADTMPPMPVLPPSETVNCRCAPILPAWQFDASDRSDEAVAYCPICALEGVRVSGLRDAEGYYPLPRGKRVLCGEHTMRWEQRLDGDTL